MRPDTSPIRSATIGASILLAVILASCGGGWNGGQGNRGDWDKSRRDRESAPGPERRVLVEVAPTETGSVADHLTTSGTLEGEFQADLFPEATGLVTKVMVEEGDEVRAGQGLAVIANPSLDASAERAQVDVTKARRAMEEAERLHASGAVSDKELQDARDTLALSQASFGEATRSHGFKRIESPIDGTVSIRELRVGELASGGQRAFQVVDLSRLRVVVQLPERDLPRISVDQTALLTGAYDDSSTVDGTIRRISPVVDPATGTVKVTIAVQPNQTAIRPGQYVKVRVEVDRHSDVLTIPRRALVWDDGEPVAWKLIDAEPPAPDEDSDPDDDGDPGFFAGSWGDEDDGDKAEGHPERDPWEGIPRRGVEKSRLTIGYIDTEHVEVVDGLTLSDRVVVLGNGGLRPETLVKLASDPDPQPEKDEEDEREAKAEIPAGAEG